MADMWEKKELADHQDQLVRARQSEAERARDARRREADAARVQREQQKSEAKAQAVAIATEGNLDAIKLHHELEPERRNWDVEQLIEEERIKLETYRSRAMIETREQLRVISAEIIKDFATHTKEMERTDQAADLTRKQTTLEREYGLIAEREKAEQKQSQTTLEHEQSLERAVIDHAHAKDFKTHETDELIRLKKTFGELTKEEQQKFFSEFEKEAVGPAEDEDQ